MLSKAARRVSPSPLWGGVGEGCLFVFFADLWVPISPLDGEMSAPLKEGVLQAANATVQELLAVRQVLSPEPTRGRTT